MGKPEDIKTPEESDGQAAGERGAAQVVKAEGGSTIQNVVQAVVHLMISPLGLALLALGLVLAAAIFNVPTLQGLLPTPPPFEAAGEGETLVIVAKFDNRSEGQLVGVDPSSSELIYLLDPDYYPDDHRSFEDYPHSLS